MSNSPQNVVTLATFARGMRTPKNYLLEISQAWQKRSSALLLLRARARTVNPLSDRLI